MKQSDKKCILQNGDELQGYKSLKTLNNKSHLNSNHFDQIEPWIEDSHKT